MAIQNDNGRNKSSTTKATRGRQKIQIKKMENESSRQVTFSKRRNGLFKKASELSVLCGADIAIIVFSPKGKTFTFGHPTVETILERYNNGNPTFQGEDSATATATATSTLCFEEFNVEFEEALEKLEEEKKRSKEIEREKEEMKKKDEFWWDAPIDNMGLEELEAYVKAMEELKINVVKRENELMSHGGGGLGMGYGDQNVIGGFGGGGGSVGGIAAFWGHGLDFGSGGW